MLWAAIHLPALSLEAFTATLGPVPSADLDDAAPEPAQPGTPDTVGPVALIERHRLVAVNAAGRELGLKPGLRRATALGLVPRLRLGEADPARDEAQLMAAAHALLGFTPAVTLGGDGVVLAEVQASLRYFGGLTALLERVAAALHPLGHEVHIACASTPRAAHWLAQWHDEGTGGARPPRTKTELRARVGRLPLALMAGAQPHLETLGTLGLVTADDLWRQPRAGVNRRFGNALLADLDRACGDLPDPRTWLQPPPEFDSRVELFTRAEDAAALGVGAAVLLQRLTAWAAACHGRIAAFHLRLHHESNRRSRNDPAARLTVIEVGLGEPVSDAAHLQSLLHERLQRLALAAPVLELSLHCRDLIAGAPPNGELFPSATGRGEGWQRLIERLEARLGPHCLLRLEPFADFRPELATRRSPAARARGVAEPGPLALPDLQDDESPFEGQPGAWPRLRRPVWLLAEPQPLRESAGTPLLAGRPLWLLAGPERIEAGWWDEDFAARDYFIAQADDGALLWVYRFRHAPSANESGWYLHGRFG